MSEVRFKVTQERKVRRFSLTNIGSSLLDAFNLEYGLLFTLKEFILRPGKSTRSYLGEGRLRFFSPFRLLFITTALLLILMQFYVDSKDFEEGFKLGASGSAENWDAEADAEASRISRRIFELFQEYYNILIWLYIPVVSFFSWLFNFRKGGFNYAEHVVFNTCYTSIVNVFSVIMALGYYLDISTVSSIIYLVLSIIYFAWYYRDLFNKSWIRALLEGLIITILSASIYAFSLGISLGLLIAKGVINL